MAMPETEMEMVCRHVEQGERHVREEQVRLARLREIGGAADTAEDILELMISLLADHRLHLKRLLS